MKPFDHPAHAKQFLEKMLSTYAEKVGIRSLSNILSAEALDRLVLASGAVQRDYLVLCADSLTRHTAIKYKRLTNCLCLEVSAGIELAQDRSVPISQPTIVSRRLLAELAC